MGPKADAAPNPGGVRERRRRRGRTNRRPPSAQKVMFLPVAHVGMPAPGRVFCLPQPGAGQGPGRKRTITAMSLGNRRSRFPEQFPPWGPSRSPSGQPCELRQATGDGATAINHADHDGRGLIALERRVKWPGPSGPKLHQARTHFSRGREAERDIQLGPAEAAPIAGRHRAIRGDIGAGCATCARGRGRRPTAF